MHSSFAKLVRGFVDARRRQGRLWAVTGVYIVPEEFREDVKNVGCTSKQQRLIH
jgi:hypothetical protein